MRKIIRRIIILSLVFTLNQIMAQIDENSARKAANDLFNFCKNNNFSSAASILAYHGSDETRLFKDLYNYSNSAEASEVKRICNRIKAMIEISDSYEFGSLKQRKLHGKNVQSLDVVFKSGNQKIKNNLTFIEVKGKTVVLKLD